MSRENCNETACLFDYGLRRDVRGRLWEYRSRTYHAASAGGSPATPALLTSLQFIIITITGIVITGTMATPSPPTGTITALTGPGRGNDEESTR